MNITKTDMVALVALGFALVAQDAYAVKGDLNLDVHAASHHYGFAYDGDMSNYQYNERAHGIGIEYEIDNHVSVGGGYIINSYHIGSGYAGLSIHSERVEGFSGGVRIGYLPSYETTPVSVISVMPTLHYQHGRMAAKIGILPGAVTTLTLSFKLN